MEDVDMEDVYSSGLESDSMGMDSGLGKSIDVNEQGRGSRIWDINVPEELEMDWSSPSTEKQEDCKEHDDDEESEDGIENEKERRYTHILVSDS
jgi:hypothetical protein